MRSRIITTLAATTAAVLLASGAPAVAAPVAGAGSVAAWSAPSAAASKSWLRGFSGRGVPVRGKALLGASSVNATQDPQPLEAALGSTLALHRSFWRGDQVSQAVARAEQDLRAGRLPWLSFRMPYAPGTTTPLTWADMAAGAGDAWAADIAARLGALSGPVWVAFSHEPENDGGDPQQWKAMQLRLSPILRARPNIAFTVIVMGWHQFIAPARNPALSMSAIWPGSQYVDVTGFDPYNWYGTTNGAGKTNSTFTELKAYYKQFARWSKSVGGARWALAETGLSDAAAARDVAWISRAFTDLKAAGGAGMAYYQSDAQASFALNGAKLRVFGKALRKSARITDGRLPAWSIVGTSLGIGFGPAWVTGKARTTSVSVRWAKPAATRPATKTRYSVLLAVLDPATNTWGANTPGCSVKAPHRSCTVRKLARATTYRATVVVGYSDGRGAPQATGTFTTKG